MLSYIENLGFKLENGIYTLTLSNILLKIRISNYEGVGVILQVYTLNNLFICSFYIDIEK